MFNNTIVSIIIINCYYSSLGFFISINSAAIANGSEGSGDDYKVNKKLGLRIDSSKVRAFEN